MLIECLIPEVDNLVTSGQTMYHFRRAGGRDTPMLCNVVDDTHAADILSREGFRAVRAGDDDVDDDEDDALSDGDDADGDQGDGEPGDHEPTGGAASAGGPYDMLTLDELREKFHVRFGRAAHPQIKPETLVARLVEDDEAKHKPQQ